MPASRFRSRQVRGANSPTRRVRSRQPAGTGVATLPGPAAGLSSPGASGKATGTPSARRGAVGSARTWAQGRTSSSPPAGSGEPASGRSESARSARGKSARRRLSAGDPVQAWGSERSSGPTAPTRFAVARVSSAPARQAPGSVSRRPPLTARALNRRSRAPPWASSGRAPRAHSRTRRVSSSVRGIPARRSSRACPAARVPASGPAGVATGISTASASSEPGSSATRARRRGTRLCAPVGGALSQTSYCPGGREGQAAVPELPASPTGRAQTARTPARSSRADKCVARGHELQPIVAVRDPCWRPIPRVPPEADATRQSTSRLAPDESSIRRTASAEPGRRTSEKKRGVRPGARAAMT